MALIAPPKEYEPVFDETDGLYKDVMPWPKHFRGPKDQYICLCNQFEFGSNTKFNQISKKLLCLAPEYFKHVTKLFKKNLLCGTSLEIIWGQKSIAENHIKLIKIIVF